MPGQDFKNWDTYTTAPILVFQIQTFARLNAIESMVFNHVVLYSINVFGVKSSNARKCVTISPSTFGSERGFSRQAVLEALKRLVELGLITSKEVVVQTNSGAQIGREYCLVSNKKLYEIFELLSTSAIPQGDKSRLSPSIIKKTVGDNHHLSPRQAPLVTLTGLACHLDRPHLSPLGVIVPKSLNNFVPKEFLKTFNYFLKTISSFENSFYELYCTQANSKAAEFKIKTKIVALIRQYGLYSTFIAMVACLFSKDAQIGNFDALKAFLKQHELKLQEQEQKLVLHSDNLFLKILKIHEETSVSRLETFMESFRQNASVLLIQDELEASSSIFLYSEFHQDIIAIFEVCNFNNKRFTNEVITKLNLYFKAKILGMKGLSFAQSDEDHF